MGILGGKNTSDDEYHEKQQEVRDNTPSNIDEPKIYDNDLSTDDLVAPDDK